MQLLALIVFPCGCPVPASGATCPPALRTPRSALRISSGFTLVEVMMASLVLVLAFFGMITALTAGNEMMATARRQTLASKMIDHEIESVRLLGWSTVSGLASTHASNTGLVWTSGTTYRVRDLVVHNGAWYRCIQNTGSQNPTNASFWTALSPPYVIAFNSSANPNVAEGATFTLSRAVADVSGLTNVKELTFTVTWTVKPGGGVASRTYTRRKSTYVGQYGLNLTYQRS